ncbi:MAG: aldehyde dehydrogenase family protein [Actinomycetota bacterium]|nr:aldehyde dehydrogenase family protein [Actinomycetota bacterium]
MTALDEIQPIIERVRQGFRGGVIRDLASRQTQLRQLRRFLVECEGDINSALHEDLGKHATEAYGTEIGFTIAEVDHALAHVQQWCQPIKVRVPLTFRPGTAAIVPEPLGTLLIIAPWNYPVQLSLAPLVAALAAGNTAVLKLSEVSAATSAVLSRNLPEYLDARAVGVVTGAVAESTALLRERFDHIFFTGNGTVGRVVLRAAAEHLTPVTLELGGKSPAIVASDADIDIAARRITWGKYVNAGQTCLAPDYVLVSRDVEDRLLGALLRAIHDMYGESPSASADYGRIVSDHHFDRLTGLLDAGGYEAVVTGGSHDRARRYFAPTVLAGVDPEAAIMGEEIFGPILAVLPVDGVDEAVHFVNERPSPLALYVFSENAATAERVVERTTSGGVTINHTLLHCAVNGLPFGGVGDSGTGAYHGRAGFDTFSHRKSVLTKPIRPDPSIMYPPYKRWKDIIIRRVL